MVRLLVVLWLFTISLASQVDPFKTTDANITGPKAFGSYNYGEFDSVELSSGTLNLNLEIASMTARGHQSRYALMYSSKFWQPSVVLLNNQFSPRWNVEKTNLDPVNTLPSTMPLATGWRDTIPRLTKISSKAKCRVNTLDRTVTLRTNFVYSDENGSKHNFPNWEWVSGSQYASYCGIPINAYNGGYSSDAQNFQLNGIQAKSPSGITDVGNGFIDTNGNTWSPLIAANGQTFAQKILAGNKLTGVQELDSSGIWRTWTVSYSTKVPSETFQNPSPYSLNTKTLNVISHIDLPNSTSYVFEYNASAGELSKVYLPTGGYIRYEYVTKLKSQYTSDSYSQITDDRYVSKRAVSPDGNPLSEQVWNYTYTFANPNLPNSDLTTRVDKPDGSYEIHTFHYLDSYREMQSDFYSSAGVLLCRIQKTWEWDTGLVPNSSWSNADDYGNFELPSYDGMNVRLKSETTVLDDGQQKKTTYTYDGQTYTDMYGVSVTRSRGNVKKIEETAYGGGAPGPVARVTKLTYLHEENSAYQTPHIEDRITAKWIGTPTTTESFTRTGYDTTTPAGLHGNLSAAKAALLIASPPNPDSPPDAYVARWLTTAAFYDSFGNLTQITDPLSHTSSFEYSQCNSGFPTAKNYPIAGLREERSWNCNIGAISQKRGLNGELTNFEYNDVLSRPTRVTRPDGGQTNISYNDVAPISGTASQQIDPTTSLLTTTTFDGLGRTKQTKLSDPSGDVYADTTYDNLSRAWKVTNPYRTVASSTDGITETQYDGIGRPVKVIKQDGSFVSNAYTANCTTTTDEAGKKKKICSNALDQLTEVYEDPLGLNYQTVYQYDTLGNLKRVDQKGSAPTDSSKWRTRLFTYDALSRLLSANNPESGLISYTYDDDGNVVTKISPAPNQFGAATQTILYCYDAMHRVTGKYYFAPADCQTGFAISYSYDQTSYNGLSITNGLSRRTGMSDASGQTAWSFDSKGRVVRERRTIFGITKDIAYDYNLDDSVKSVTYPSGMVITNTYDSAGHLLSARDLISGVDYAISPTYAPTGALTSLTYQGSNGFKLTNHFNNRLQPDQISAEKLGTNAGTILSRTYSFGTTLQNNGNISAITDNITSDRSVVYSYDALNRIASAASTGTDCSVVPSNPSITKNWGNTYSIDAWGNLFAKNVTKCSSESLSTTANEKNQIGIGVYDAAGNLTSNGTATYSYDAENRLASTAGTIYVYDGDGVRVKKSGGSSTPTLYWGQSFTAGPLAESDLSGNIQAEYVFFAGKRVARRDLLSGATHFYFADHLNSTNLVYSDTGTLEEDSDYYPYGNERAYVLGGNDHFKFTGKERDAETGLDYFGARYYGSNMGRWLSADWSATPEAVPYADLTDPQTLNLYGYVRNNPLSHADADGHCCAPYELADYVDSKLNPGAAYFQNAAVNSGSPALAATTTFVTGSAASVGAGFTNLLRTGESVGSLPSNASGAQVVSAVAEEGGRVGGTILAVVAVAGPKAPASPESGAQVAGEIGRNRVEVNGSQVDLAGKAHFEKSTGESVATPHIKDGTLHTGPTGSSVTYGPTRPATVGDVNAAARTAGATPPVRIPPPLPVPKKENQQ